jgi:pyridoxamine 5'-phosphate oxidase family protein
MIFTAAEREYLHRTMLGRLSTIGPDGAPQNRPVAFRVNDDDTVDIGGPANATTRKYKNIESRPQVSLVVDDMTPEGPDSIKPGFGRGVEIRGRAELIMVDVSPVAPGFFSNEVIRIHPQRVISWELERERAIHARWV